MKLGTAITPFSLLENGRQNESKIIEYQQQITKNRGDYWRTRTNKILEDGGNPIKWPDKLKAFDKVNTKNIQFKKNRGFDSHLSKASPRSIPFCARWTRQQPC